MSALFNSTEGNAAVPRKKTVVFVDDYPAILDVLSQQMYERYHDRYLVKTCPNAAALLQLLQKEPADLICLDLAMPVMDGLQTLKLIHKIKPDLPVIILTGKAVEDGLRKEIEKSGAVLFLQKATSSQEYDSLFIGIETLLENVRKSSFRVSLEDISLPELIQLKCSRQASALCEIEGRDMTGRIFIESGQVIHAEYGEWTGFEAFWRMVSLDTGIFHAKEFCAPPQKTLNERWEGLLLEAARVIDETSPPVIKGREILESGQGASAFDDSLSSQILPPGEEVAISQTHAALLRSINDGRAFIVKTLLLTEPAIINEPYGEGWTPLMMASWLGNIKTVKTLLEHGAKVEALSNHGYTPLMIAVHKGHEPVVLALLAEGANPHAADKDSRTILIWGAQNGSESIVREILARQVDIGLRDSRGMSALDYAARERHEGVVALLQKHTQGLS